MNNQTLLSTLKDWCNSNSGPTVMWAGLRLSNERGGYRLFRDGRPEVQYLDEDRGVMAEVMVDGQLAYAATSATTPSAIAAALSRAKILAGAAAPHSIHRWTKPTLARPLTSGKYRSPTLRPLRDLRSSDATTLLTDVCKRLKKGDAVVRTTSFLRTLEGEQLQAGCDLATGETSLTEQEFSFLTVDFESTTKKGPVIQRRSDCGMRGRTHQGGLELLYTDGFWGRVDRVAEEALELLDANPCPTEKCDLILMPDQMMLQIHESIGHPLELDRILGDERNYAGWSFVNLEDFGKLRYGSDLLNVTFDPTVAGELASYGFDDTGALAKREHLIENGILKRALGSVESQHRAGVPGVSNGRASSWNRPPIDRMANLNVEPGTSTWAEILASVENGVIMESNRSWSIDDFRNKFQFGCEYGKRVKNGKIVGTVRDPNYRGISAFFWKSLKKVGDRSTFQVYGTPNCGKGEPNQMIRVGHASPVCVFADVEVFGGGAA